ncbi:protein bicaudal D-like isoform X1 [Stegodyphus dumicola]|uniref:protein bicaudal D-like isoform X1 n=1 Tax=Stegodyphus dumicola TaxID=202533 RepID=UPI0015AF1782|nr:protein bicaudal D-like isoform X1 [Stegodyphus dumicola]
MTENLESLRQERDLLKQELERLGCELEQTTHEKNLSAQYGLVLLDEKEALQQRCEELESCYDSSKAELELLREALAKYQTNQKVTASSGIEQEESLLLETASKEATFTSTVLELEKELKQARQEVSRVGVEKERILQENIDLAKNCDVSEWEKRNYKAELKELKLREARLLSDNNELEEENISLQKQISSLRSSQVEFEGAKHEVRRLQEELEAAQGQIEELFSLKRIAEKQLEEALEALQSEREQKYALKKELDQRVNSESIFNINNLGFSGFGLGSLNQEDGDKSEDEGDNDTTLVLSPTIEKDSIGKPQSSTVNDLFSELHLSEVRKLEKQLEATENEKAKITSRLQETQQQLEKTKAELSDQNSRVHRMVEHINALIALHGKCGEIEDGSGLEDPEKDIPELSRLKTLLTKHEQRYQLAVQQVEQLQNDVRGLQQQGATISEDDEAMNRKLREEVTELKIKVQTFSNKIKELEDDLYIMGQIAKKTRSALNFTQDDLIAVSEELAQLYHHVCMVNGETPSRIMLDHVKGSHTAGVDSGVSLELSESNKEESCSTIFNMHSSNLDTLKEKLKSDIAIKILLEDDKSENRSDSSIGSNRLLDTIRDQLSHLTKAVENTIEIYWQKTHHSGSQEPSSLAEVEDLQEQVIKLKSMLSTKREQVATLRTVLKANKQTAEVALANLKSKYENEKAVVSETMMKLRNDLKVLKEDAATFASLRAMFAARCEEYVTQLDELQRQLTSSEEQKKTLNALLRLAISQKIAIAQKLEDLEMDKEKSHGRRHSSRGRNVYSRGSGHQSSGGASAFSGTRHNHEGNHYHSRRDY